MTSSVLDIDVDLLKSSLKRNVVGLTLTSILLVSVITYVVITGTCSYVLALYVMAGLLILFPFLMYWTVISLLIDRALFSIWKRTKA